MFVIERISKEHNARHFLCGTLPDEATINNFISRNARRADEEGKSITYVLADEEKTVSGYVTFGRRELPVGRLPSDELPIATGESVPVLEIYKLGTVVHLQGRGYGRDLLHFAFEQACIMNEVSPIVAITLMSTEGKQSWYEHNGGFTRLIPDPETDRGRTPMFVALPRVKAVLAAARIRSS